MKCGIEIHQRLSGGKLFCGCSGESKAAEGALGGISFSRRLHSVRSELGEMDSAVRLEAVRERLYEYSAARMSACLVEADEEPPHELDRDALQAALSVCLMLNSSIVDEIHVMRKNVIDGSNTSGFQRTALIGLGGAIKTPSGKLGIQSICLEEESAGIVDGGEEKVQYSLDRLGIPLIEIATEPGIKSGKEAEEAALAIGALLRKTGMVQRGIGTIRQDLNISTEKGARVEIKGVQDLSMVKATVELEVARKEKILAILSEAKSRLKGRKIEEKFVDLTGIFSETRSPMVSKMLKGGSKALGISLPGYAGLLGIEVGPNRRLGSELAGYARSAGVKGIIHSDEQMEKYGISDDELSEIKVALSLSSDSAFALVIAEEGKARAALSEVAKRASYFGVMEETRKANPDGTSSYMRPLPGRARMYPETDVSHIIVTKEMISGAKKAVKAVSEAEGEKESALSALPEELRAQLLSAKNLIMPTQQPKPGFTPEISAFALAASSGIDPKLAASEITNTLASLKREGTSTKKISENRLLDALSSCQSGLFAKAALPEILRQMCKDEEITAKFAAHELSLERISGAALEALISSEKLDMGSLMAKYRLRVDAGEAQGIFEKRKG